MRVRTAVVKPIRADGVFEIFERAVKRRLAWVIGTGHTYADLESRAHSHGYSVWNFQTSSEESESFWVAIRNDLIEEDSVLEEADAVEFTATHEGLGSIRIGFGLDAPTVDEQVLAFELDAAGTPYVLNDADRISNSAKDKPSNTVDFEYVEHVFIIDPIKE